MHCCAASALKIRTCGRRDSGNPATVAHIERLDVDEPGPEANAWLSHRIGVGTVLDVSDRHQVWRMHGALFVRNWQELLCPSRDDAVILSEGRGVVLFYCHEDESSSDSS